MLINKANSNLRSNERHIEEEKEIYGLQSEENLKGVYHKERLYTFASFDIINFTVLVIASLELFLSVWSV